MILREPPWHRHPMLVRPVSPATFLGELREIWRRCRGARACAPAVLFDEGELARAHERDPRRYAWVFTQGSPLFCFAPQTLLLPRAQRLALIAHEIGHVLAPRGNEDDADEAARCVLGIGIRYSPRWPGKGLQTVAR